MAAWSGVEVSMAFSNKTKTNKTLFTAIYYLAIRWRRISSRSVLMYWEVGDSKGLNQVTACKWIGLLFFDWLWFLGARGERILDRTREAHFFLIGEDSRPGGGVLRRGTA